MSLLRWIWGLLSELGRLQLALLRLIWSVLSSLITWICVAIGYVIQTIYSWFEGVVDDFAGVFGEMAFEQFPESTPLASWLLHDVCAVDVAFSVLASVAVVWVAAKLARLAMIPIRAVLDVL